MFKANVSYTDYDGNKRKKDLYFNLSQAEVIEIEMLTPGVLTDKMSKAVDEGDIASTMKLLKFLIVKSYGEKSDDGNQFIKNQAVVDKFLQTEAYSEFLMMLLKDPKYALDFMVGLMPDLPEGVDVESLKKDVLNDPKLVAFKAEQSEEEI